MASRRLSTSLSTRETKKLATERTSIDSPVSRRRSSPRMYASATSSYADTANRSVTFTLMPSKTACSIAGTPAGVPGILMKTFGRPRRCQ